MTELRENVAELILNELDGYRDFGIDECLLAADASIAAVIAQATSAESVERASIAYANTSGDIPWHDGLIAAILAAHEV